MIALTGKKNEMIALEFKFNDIISIITPMFYSLYNIYIHFYEGFFWKIIKFLLPLLEKDQHFGIEGVYNTKIGHVLRHKQEGFL